MIDKCNDDDDLSRLFISLQRNSVRFLYSVQCCSNSRFTYRKRDASNLSFSFLLYLKETPARRCRPRPRCSRTTGPTEDPPLTVGTSPARRLHHKTICTRRDNDKTFLVGGAL